MRLAAGTLALLLALLVDARAARADESGGASWATAQATEQTTRAKADVARGDVSGATRRLLDAIRFDATYAPAYLALGGLYETTGAAREAERTYTMGLEHVAAFSDARLARGRLLARERRYDDALIDLEMASMERPDDLALLRELMRTYNTARVLPAALATARRLVVVAAYKGDAEAGTEGRVLARALSILVGDADPVAAGKRRGSVRRALATLAARPR